MKRYLFSAIKNRAFVNSQALTMAVCIRTDDSRARRHRDRRPVWRNRSSNANLGPFCTSRRAEPSTSLRPAIERAADYGSSRSPDRSGLFHCRDMPDIGLHPRHSGDSSILACATSCGPIDPDTRVAATGELFAWRLPLPRLSGRSRTPNLTTGVPSYADKGILV